MSDFQFELVGDGTPSVYQTPTLFKRDSKGKVRTWAMQLTDEGHYRTLSGLHGGKQAESGWTVPTPKSKPTVKEQGEFEVRAMVKHQLDREYHDTIDTIDTPKMIEPMLAKKYEAFPGPGFVQHKLDGIRCIMTKDGMFTREGQPITAVPHLFADAKPMFVDDPTLILDGELYNHELRDDFGEISSVVRKKNPTADDLAKAEKVMQYHVYDVVDTKQRFYERYQRLLAAVQKLGSSWICLVVANYCPDQGNADAFYGNSLADGYEGSMFRLDDPYQLGRRSPSLLKRKEFLTREFPVVAIHKGIGNWADAIKRFTLRNDDGSEFGAGVRGKRDLLTEWANNEACQPTDKAVATLRYFMLSPDGVPRFPVIIDYHPDGRKD